MVLLRNLTLMCLAAAAPAAAFIPTSSPAGGLRTARKGELQTTLSAVLVESAKEQKVVDSVSTGHGEGDGGCGQTEGSTCPPGQLRQASLNRWLMLPDSWNATAVQGRKAKESWTGIKALSPDHPLRLGLTRKQRSAELINAAELGNATRLELLLQAGADIDAMDLYSISSLHYAAWYGHIEAVNVLLKWGANAESQGPGGTSPLRAAVGYGHAEVIAALNCSRLPSIKAETQLGETTRSLKVKTLMTLDSDHVGAGSFYIDNAFSHDFIEKLLRLHESLRQTGPQHGRAMQSTHASRRSHYCDTEGWLCATLAAALQLSQKGRIDLPPLQHVFTHVRFVSYGNSSYLAPHKDLPVLNRLSGRTSTHTFILYLTTCAQGGDTLLLDHLAESDRQMNGTELGMRHAVQPVRGRLFVFPHACPHAGRHVVEGTKLIVRGDLC